MAYEHILGHTRPIAQLERARQTGRVAHAYLFHGPAGVGKERVALAFATALNCAGPEPRPCGACDPCGKIARGVHPDVRLLACEAELVRRGQQEAGKSAPSSQIKIEQLDEQASFFRHAPYAGRTKVLLVVDAERMNLHCQNRFLKTLEEPSADTLIVLVSAQPEALLPTIRSRCQALAFGPLPRELLARHLHEARELPLERARVVAAMAQGSLGQALALAEEGFLEERDQLVQGLARALEGDLADALEVAGAIGEGREARERLEVSLALLELWLRDVLLCCLGVDPGQWVNQDQAEELGRAAARVDPARLFGWLDRIREVRASLKSNANPRMAMESLLLAMRMVSA
jgi:DNA polymerase III subunit delta'